MPSPPDPQSLTILNLEGLLVTALPESGPVGPPFTLRVVADVASAGGDKVYSYHSVRRKWERLRKCPSTREIVAPVSEDWEIRLSASGARFLLRELWNCRVPVKHVQKYRKTPCAVLASR